MKKVIIASALLLALTGCNTTRGFGEDLQAAGSWLSSSAEKTQNYSSSSSASASSPSVASRFTPVEDSYSYPGDVKGKYLD